MTIEKGEAFDEYAWIPIDGLPAGANEALRLVADNLRRLNEAPVIPKRFSPPERLYDGLTAFADGEEWNPGFGRGPYCYDDNIDINGVISDGQLEGTIPDWTPDAGYSISFLMQYNVITPATQQPLFTNTIVANNDRAGIWLEPDRTLYFKHSSGAGGSIGEVNTPVPLQSGVTYAVRGTVSQGGTISISANDITATVGFNYQGAPLMDSLFVDDLGPADERVGMARMVLSDNSIINDDRVYFLDDGITGDIIDSIGGQNGTWNNITQANIGTLRGAWVPMFREI